MILTCTTCFKPSTITLGHGPSKQVPSEDGNARLDKYTQYCRWPSDSHRHVHACTYFIIHFIYYYLLIDAGFKASNTSYLAWCGPQMTHAVRWNDQSLTPGRTHTFLGPGPTMSHPHVLIMCVCPWILESPVLIGATMCNLQFPSQRLSENLVGWIYGCIWKWGVVSDGIFCKGNMVIDMMNHQI
jgi:hypothetical protein